MYCPEERLLQFGRFRWPNQVLAAGSFFFIQTFISTSYINGQSELSTMRATGATQVAEDRRCISPVRESTTSQVLVPVVFLDDWRRSSRSPLLLLLLLLLLILVALLLAVQGCLLVRYLDSHNCP
jgi:hypothetical protein